MQSRKTKGCRLGIMTLFLCALLGMGIISTALAADGGGSVSVGFVSNGGSGWMDYIETEDGAWIMPDCTFTYPGKVFGGWATSSDGSAVYQPGDVAYVDDLWMPQSGSLYMYATWDDMSAEEMQATLAPKIYELRATETETTNGVSYAKAELRFGLKSSLGDENLTVFLRLGSANGPLLPGTQSVSSDDIQSYSLTNNYVWVSVPFLADGVEQVTENGTVNGLLSNQKVYATLARGVNGTVGESNPAVFSCSKPAVYNEGDAAVAWFEDNGYGTVAYGSNSATVTLTKNTVLPTDGLALGNNSYHIQLNGHTLNGKLYTAYGETFIEQEVSGGNVLAAYTDNRQTLNFSACGLSASAQPTGSMTATLNNMGSLVCDPAYVNATVTNGSAVEQSNYTAAGIQSWGYANTGLPAEYTIDELQEDELAAHIPKNVTATLQDNSLVVEYDYDPDARGNNVRVDVILSDGTTARLLDVSTFSSSYKDQMIYTLGERGHISVGEVRCITAEEYYNFSEKNGQNYVDGIKDGDTLSVTVNAEVGAYWQETGYSTPPVSFTYRPAAVGTTFGQGNNNTVSRAYLPEVATLTVNSPLTATYTGEAVTLDYTLTMKDGTPLTAGVDYTEEYSNNYNVGTATLALTGIGGYAGQIIQPFTIAGIDLNSEAVDAELAYYSTVYDGSSQTPAVVVTYDGQVLSKSKDYYVSYENNTNPGTATVTLTPGYNGTFTGSRTETFTIDPRSMNSPALQAFLSQNRYVWTEGAGPFTPEVNVKWGDKKLTEGTDYTLTYQNNSSVGTASAVITGKGNYSDTRVLEYTIFRPVGLDDAATIDPIAPEIYTGEELEPKVTVKVGNQILTEGWDYSVSYSNNVKAGEATVTVTGRRDYTGEKTATFTIDPADLGVLAAQGALTMTLKKSEYPYGDAIYTFSGGEKKPEATLTLVDPEDSWNNIRLYEGTSYTLSFENNIEAGTATAIATGTGNYGGMCTAEYTINPLNLNDLYSAAVADTTYNGQAQMPAISMYTSSNGYSTDYYLMEGEDYTVTGWANNTNAETATVTVTGAGNNFTGTREIDFTIDPMPLSDRNFDVSAVATKVGEDGAELHNLTVTWKQNGRNLVEGTDFTVENLYSSGNYAYFYLKGMGNFGSQTGIYDVRLTDEIGTLPVSSNPDVINPSWSIDKNGVMTVKGWGELSKQSGWSAYAGLVKKIVVQNYDATNKFSYISSGTFEDFYNATECTLPEGVTTVDPDAFPKNNKMTVHLPDGITTINTDYWSNFEFVKAQVHQGSTTETTIRNSDYPYFGYEEYPGCQLLDSSEYGLKFVKYSGNGGTVVIPDGVEWVEASGLEGHGIERMVVPGSVKNFHNSFMTLCYDLREIVIQPGVLTTLPDYFLDRCNNVTVYIPDNITEIGSNFCPGTPNCTIVANCNSYAIEWAKNQGWKEDNGTGGRCYRLVHKHPTEHSGKAATCEEPGWTAYTTCTDCNYNNKVDIPALGHSYGAVQYEWNKDHTSVMATRVCKHDASHKQTETVAATAAVTTPATCISAGVRTYTSAVFTNPVFRVQKYTEAIPVGGHAWRAERSTAATDTANGIRGGAVCNICGEEQQERTVSAQKVMKIPAMMNTIESEAFMATAAEQINVPAETAFIGDGAFANCDDLLLVVIPGTGTTLTGNPFSGSDVAVICPDNSQVATWCDLHRIPHNP